MLPHKYPSTPKNKPIEHYITIKMSNDNYMVKDKWTQQFEPNNANISNYLLDYSIYAKFKNKIIAI